MHLKFATVASSVDMGKSPVGAAGERYILAQELAEVLGIGLATLVTRQEVVMAVWRYVKVVFFLICSLMI